MTTQLFIILFIGLCAISTLLTEAIKKFFSNSGKEASANIIALIDAVIVGVGGTSAAYVILGIAFDATSIIALVCMSIGIWIGSMIGYDKVIQTIKQLFDKQ